MDYTKLDLRQCFDLACSEFGLEDDHTRGIGKLLDLAKAGYLDQTDAKRMAQIIYHHGSENLYYNDAWDEEDPWDEDEEYLNGTDEMGFDPYMGCYTGDC